MYLPNEPNEFDAELSSFTKKKIDEILDGAYINHHNGTYYYSNFPIRHQYDRLYDNHYDIDNKVTFSDFEKAYKSTIDLRIDLKNFIDDSMDLSFAKAVVSAYAPLPEDKYNSVIVAGVSEGIYPDRDTFRGMSYKQLCIAMDKMSDFSVVCDSIIPLCTEISLPMADHDGDSNIFRKIMHQYESFRPINKSIYYSKKSDNYNAIPKTVSTNVNSLLARSKKD